MRTFLLWAYSDNQDDKPADCALLTLDVEAAQRLLRVMNLLQEVRREDDKVFNLSRYDHSARFLNVSDQGDRYEELQAALDDIPDDYKELSITQLVTLRLESGRDLPKLSMDSQWARIDNDSVYWCGHPHHDPTFVTTSEIPRKLLEEIAGASGHRHRHRAARRRRRT